MSNFTYPSADIQMMKRLITAALGVASPLAIIMLFLPNLRLSDSHNRKSYDSVHQLCYYVVTQPILSLLPPDLEEQHKPDDLALANGASEKEWGGRDSPKEGSWFCFFLYRGSFIWEGFSGDGFIGL